MNIPFFFALLRSGLWERPLSDSESKEAAKLGEADWAAIAELARQQTVSGLLYRAVTHLPSDFRISGDFVVDLMALCGGIVQENRLKNAVTKQLFEECARSGLHPVVMKGQSVAVYYTHPELRISGDIDLYFPPEEFPRAQSLFNGETGTDGTGHFHRNGVDIDMHKRYFELHRRERSLPPVGTPEATILLLSSHILKHAIGPGVGLRQCCDLAAAWHALAPSIDPAAMREIFRRNGLLRWNRLLFSFLAEYLGLSENPFRDERVSPAPLLQIVLEGGNFGHHAKARTGVFQADMRRRKLNTVGRFLHRLPFSLRYAPRETIATIADLVRGNLSAAFQ